MVKVVSAMWTELSADDGQYSTSPNQTEVSK